MTQDNQAIFPAGGSIPLSELRKKPVKAAPTINAYDLGSPDLTKVIFTIYENPLGDGKVESKVNVEYLIEKNDKGDPVFRTNTVAIAQVIRKLYENGTLHNLIPLILPELIIKEKKEESNEGNPSDQRKAD